MEGPILGAVGFPKTTTTTITTTIDLPYIPPLNPKLVNRMVGYLEYGRALYLLDQLAKNCSAKELEVIDEIIRSRDEHAVFVNRSRILERESSALSEQPQETNDEFERRGLAWLTALARVELGALAAGFTDYPDPFALAPPGNLDRDEYAEVLLDSLRTHYWALRNDPIAANMPAARISDTQAIAYGRRVSITLAFLQAVRELQGARLAPEQLAELNRWQTELTALRGVIIWGKLKLFPNGTASVRSKSFNPNHDLLSQCCPALNNIIAGDLAAGRATVNGQPISAAQGQQLLQEFNRMQNGK